MTEEQAKRIRALVDAGVVEWMPGMVDTFGDRVLSIDDAGEVTTSELQPASQSSDTHVHGPSRDCLTVPDITDPATRGCLLEQLRRRDPTSMTSFHPMAECSPWRCWTSSGEQGRGDTEGDAILAAFEALP